MLHALCHLILITVLWGKDCYYPQSMDRVRLEEFSHDHTAMK